MPNNKRVIVEQAVESKPTIVNNITTNNLDIVVFKAVLQEAERPNRNHRIYTKKALIEALNREMVQEKLQKKAFVSEAGHPMEDSVKRQTYIDQSNICCIITDLQWEGNLLIGTVETANTERGRDMAGLIRQGCQVAFSMRGVGGEAKKKDGYDLIDGGLYIISYDWVIFPSHQEAYMKEIIKESVSFENITTRIEGYEIPINQEDEKILSNVKDLEEIFNERYNMTKDIERNERTSFKNNNRTLDLYTNDSRKQTIDYLFSRLR